MAFISNEKYPKAYDLLIEKIRAVGEPHYIREPFRCNKDFDTETKTVTGELTGIKNNKTMKYRVKTKALKNLSINDTVECRNGLCECRGSGYTFEEGVIERNPDWFDPVEDIQEGKYIDWLESVCRVQDIALGLVEVKPIDSDSTERVSIGQLRKESVVLTTDEIEQALIKEAKRRGLVEGAKFKTIDVKEYTFTNHYSKYQSRSGVTAKVGGIWSYDEKTDTLATTGYGNHAVYHKGEFAELVDQTPDIEINGYEPEYFDEYAKWGCAEIDKELFLVLDNLNDRYEGKKNLTSVTIGKGKFTMDEISQIADYYKKEESGINIGGEPVEVSGIGFSASNMWGNDD